MVLKLESDLLVMGCLSVTREEIVDALLRYDNNYDLAVDFLISHE